LAVAYRQVQVCNNQALSVDRRWLACIQKPMTEKEAWEYFEDGLKDAQSFDEAVEWVKKNQKMVKKLTMQAMIRKFDEDISHANKTWLN
jgi:hypothetical protein